MSQRKALIIGGGIAGLCAGIYLRRNGFDTEILEMNSLAGGLATSWTRRGYTFENCLHWLVGSKPGSSLNELWREVFDIERLRFHDGEIYQVIERDGRRLAVFKQVDRMEQEFLEKAPEDAAAVKEFCRLVRRLARFRFPGGKTPFSRAASAVAALPYLPALAKYRKETLASFSGRFQNPLAREFFGAGLASLSFLAVAFSLAWMAAGDAGYPIGGSRALIGLIEDTYASIGGRIRFNARVVKVLAEKGRASGVVLENGERLGTDIVVSAADGYATIFELLGKRFLSDKIRDIYRTYRRFPSYVQVSAGIAADLSGEPEFLSLGLEREIEVDLQTRARSLSVRVFHFDPTFAPPGKTAITVFLPTANDAYWRGLRERKRDLYVEEKGRLSHRVLAALEKRFPAARDRIEVFDVATPATVVRYTGNWHGSMEGWMMTPETGFRQLPAVLPGLKGFYMVGQWISPGGGLPSGLLTARAVSRLICREYGLPWCPD